jgi:glycosyltransferase involved in cell wall biosynthesis
MPTLFLLGSLCIGGSERKTLRVVNALHIRGHSIHLAWLNGPEALRHEIDPGVPAVCFDRRGKLSWRTLRRLERYVKVHGITQIICINLYPLLYAKALRLVMGSAAPSCVVTVNITQILRRKDARQLVFYAPLMRRADGVVFGSQYQLSLWVKRYRLPRMKCRYIHNGVDSNYFSAQAIGSPDADHRAAFGLGPDDFVVGTVGNFRPEKQLTDLIETVSRLRKQGLCVFAVIVGGGVNEDALKKQTADLGMTEYIRFPGEIRDVRPALAAMDVFVLTSASETFSNAALEAMAMDRPVVLSDVDGAREMVRDGINGYLYPVSDVEHLAAILGRLAANPDARRRMGEEARRIVVEQFSFSRMVDEYETLCRGIIKR